MNCQDNPSQISSHLSHERPDNDHSASSSKFARNIPQGSVHHWQQPQALAAQATNNLSTTMSNPLDRDAGSELFSSYEAELKLVQADLNQKLDQITEQSGEPRKSAIRLAERSLEEANELVLLSPTPINCPIEPQLTPTPPARPNAHRKTKHPLNHPLPPKPPLPQLRKRHRCLEKETRHPFLRPHRPLRLALPRRRQQSRPPIRATSAIAVGHGPVGSEFATVAG